MRTTTSHRVAFLLLLVNMLAGLSPAWADEIRLTNGDRLTGTIVNLEQGSLILTTSYGGTLTIDWKEIQSFTSQSPLTIQVQDGSKFRGTAELTEPGQVVILDADTGFPTPVPLLSILAINPPPNVRYTGDTSLGGNQTSGNTDTASLNASTRWTIRTDSHAVVLEGKYNYAESDDAVTARNARGAFDYSYFVTETLFINLEELVEQDTFQALSLRSTTSVAMGWTIYDDKRHKLIGSAGLGYVYSNFKAAATTQDPTATWKARWEFSLVPDKVNVFHHHQGFQDFGSDSTAFRLNADQGVKITVYKNLYLNMEFDYRFNSDPERGRKKSDHAFIVGVGWQLSN